MAPDRGCARCVYRRPRRTPDKSQNVSWAAAAIFAVLGILALTRVILF